MLHEQKLSSNNQNESISHININEELVNNTEELTRAVETQDVRHQLEASSSSEEGGDSVSSIQDLNSTHQNELIDHSLINESPSFTAATIMDITKNGLTESNIIKLANAARQIAHGEAPAIRVDQAVTNEL